MVTSLRDLPVRRGLEEGKEVGELTVGLEFVGQRALGDQLDLLQQLQRVSCA